MGGVLQPLRENKTQQKTEVFTVLILKKASVLYQSYDH